MPYVEIGVRCLIGTVFLVASLSKVGHRAFGAFAASLTDLRLLPRRTVRPVAAVVVAGEFASWLLLAIPTTVTGVAGLLAAAALLVAFGTGILAALRRGALTPCRCFGATTVTLGIPHVVRNLVLAAVALAAVPVVLAPGTTHPGMAALAAVAGLLLGGLVTVGDDLADLLHPMPTAGGRGTPHHRTETHHAATGRGPDPRRADRRRGPATHRGRRQAAPRAH